MTSGFVSGSATSPDKSPTASTRADVVGATHDGHVTEDVSRLDQVLMSELSTVNHRLGRYVLRFHDADAGRADPVSLVNEQALADSLATAADAIRARADRRQGEGAPTTREDM